MNGSTLRYLAGVADLAKLDLESASLTLNSYTDGRMEAIYAGMYARGMRAAEAGEAKFRVHVNASQFRALASMFSDDDTLRLSYNNGLRIQSRGTNVTLKEWGEASDPIDVPKAWDFSIRLPAQALISEIEAAAEFTSESHTRPAFTGIRLAFNQGYLRVMAYDGVAALFLSESQYKIKGSGEFIVPTEDFLLGARLVGSGIAYVGKPTGSDAVIVFNKDAVFRSSVIAAEWPNTDGLMAKRNAQHFKVEANQIRNLTTGAKILTSGPDIDVTADKGRIVFRAQSEIGSFATSFKGSLASPLKYDAETLAKVIKLGPVLDFYVPDKAFEPTIVEAGHRKCWIQTRI